MGFLIIKPSSILAPYIKQYWSIESHLEQGVEHVQRIVPSGLMELSFYLGDLPEPLDESQDLPGNTIVSGHVKDYYDIKVTGKLRMISITFQPQGAMAFFNLPLNEFFNRNIPLNYFLKESTRKLESELHATDSIGKCISLIETFLLGLLKKNYKQYEIKRINHSIQLINQSRGLINIDTLASEACLSRKQYERSFLELIGVSPKLFLRTVRFQNTIYTKQMNSNLSLTQLSYGCGFYDQSHMISEFRQLAGTTPREFFSANEVSSDYFSA